MRKAHEDQESFLNFLSSLDRLVGEWECGGDDYLIYRREDGWLQLHGMDGAADRALAEVIHFGWRKKEPDGPLWPLWPAFGVCNTALMPIWLTEEEQRHFKWAVYVTTGRRLTMEAIERAMIAAGPEVLRERQQKEWAAAAPDGPRLSTEDRELMDELLADYLASR